MTIEELKAMAESQRASVTVHCAILDPVRRILCGGVGDYSSGRQWRMRMNEPHIKCCDECLRLWNSLTDEEKRLLRL